MAPGSEKQFVRWHPCLYRTALRLTGNPDHAADLAQEAIFRGLRAWGSYSGRSSLGTWLYAILLNCVRDFRRRASRTTVNLDEWSIVPASGRDDHPPAWMEHQERLTRLREAIQALSPPLRSAFAATVLDGRTYQEAADLLSVPVGTIASRVYEARSLIRVQMQKAFPEA